MTPLHDKVVFITGGARGIGAQVARRLRNKGARLVLTDPDRAELAALAAELGEDRVLTAVAEVRDLSAMQTAAARAVERFGGIDTSWPTPASPATGRCSKSIRRHSNGCWTSTCSASSTPCGPRSRR